jgi:hypothetical protein
MRINIDRLCKLAGVKAPVQSYNASSKIMREGKEEESEVLDESDELDELDESDDLDESDEIFEIDEVELVQELRRARRLMKESNQKKSRKIKTLQETEIKAIIDQEVKNVLKELNLTSGWIYGNKKPTKSKKGYVNQGSFLKGFGFK